MGMHMPVGGDSFELDFFYIVIMQTIWDLRILKLILRLRDSGTSTYKHTIPSNLVQRLRRFYPNFVDLCRLSSLNSFSQILTSCHKFGKDGFPDVYRSVGIIPTPVHSLPRYVVYMSAMPFCVWLTRSCDIYV